MHCENVFDGYNAMCFILCTRLLDLKFSVHSPSFMLSSIVLMVALCTGLSAIVTSARISTVLFVLCCIVLCCVILSYECCVVCYECCVVCVIVYMTVQSFTI